MSINLDAIQARADAATEGPWEIIGGNEYLTGIDVAIGSWDEGGIRLQDAEFIANARTDVPALLAYARDLEARIGRVREMHQQHVEFMECVNCCGDWPCPTSTALSEATGGAR